MDMSYYKTFIAIADDCPVAEGVVPESRGAAKTVAVLQYEMLASSPFVYTQEDVLFNVWLARQGFRGDKPKAEVARLREELFAKPQACLRASPLPKKYGWGLVFDEKGRVALCAAGSKEYQKMLARKDVKVLKAMRSSRG